MTIAEQLEALEALAKSAGWRVVSQQMAVELEQVMRRLATPVMRPEDDKDFLRGAIWAAQQLVDLPAKLKQKLTNDLLIEQATAAAAAPAKAGAKE